jgi:hypothetical protein
MPVRWIRASDFYHIWSKLGFLIFLTWLQWMEKGVERKATVSFNKVRFDGHLELFWLRFFNSLSAGLGGEGRTCFGQWF